MLKKLGVYTVCFLTIVSCSNETTTGSVDTGQVRVVTPDLALTDIQVIQIPDITADVYVDPCEGISNTSENYCQCFPRCCQQQTWYCPPTGTEIQAKEAILDICGEDLIPCDRNLDDTCPPAEIIFESDCTHAFDFTTGSA